MSRLSTAATINWSLTLKKKSHMQFLNTPRVVFFFFFEFPVWAHWQEIVSYTYTNLLKTFKISCFSIFVCFFFFFFIHFGCYMRQCRWNLTKPVPPHSCSLSPPPSLQVYVCSDEKPSSREYQYHRYSRHPVGGETEDQQRSESLWTFFFSSVFVPSLVYYSLLTTFSSVRFTISMENHGAFIISNLQSSKNKSCEFYFTDLIL